MSPTSPPPAMYLREVQTGRKLQHGQNIFSFHTFYSTFTSSEIAKVGSYYCALITRQVCQNPGRIFMLCTQQQQNLTFLFYLPVFTNPIVNHMSQAKPRRESNLKLVQRFPMYAALLTLGTLHKNAPRAFHTNI